MGNVAQIIHQRGEDHPFVDALTSEILVHEPDLLFTSIERQREVHLYLNDNQP